MYEIKSRTKISVITVIVHKLPSNFADHDDQSKDSRMNKGALCTAFLAVHNAPLMNICKFGASFWDTANKYKWVIWELVNCGLPTKKKPVLNACETGRAEWTQR